jgi:hypothetical protein
MAWDLRKMSKAALGPTKTGQVVGSFKKTTIYMSQLEYLAKNTCGGYFSAYQLKKMVQHMLASGDQYTHKYESEVETWVIKLAEVAKSIYDDFEGLVTSDEIVSYYETISDRYNNYTTIVKEWRLLAQRRYEVARAEREAVGVLGIEKKTDAEGNLVDDEEQNAVLEAKKKLAEEVEKSDDEKKRMLLYAGLGFAGLLVLLALVKKS